MAVLLRSPVEYISALERSMGAQRLYTPAEAAVPWKVPHMRRVGDVVAYTLDKIGVGANLVIIGGILGHLHDIACAHNQKIAGLTNAPRVLHDWERREVRLHAPLGAKEAHRGLVATTDHERLIKASVVTGIGVHHDDLKGRRVSPRQYPDVDLTELVGVFKIGDGMDAITDSDRPYSMPVSFDTAAEIITAENPGERFFDTPRGVIAQHMAYAFARQR